MSKLVKIIASIVGLSLFYIWISSTFQSCQNKKDPSDNIELVNDDLEDGEELLENVDEELFEDDDLTESSNNSDSQEESFVEFEDEPFEDSNTNSTNSNNNSTSSTSSSSSSNSSGQFMIVSGNYLVESNANAMKNKLKNMGYNSAEIVVFNGSSYHTVIAARYSDYNKAIDYSSQLKQKGIDCYVKRRS